VHLGVAQDYQLLIEHCGRESPFARADRDALRELADERLGQLRTKLPVRGERVLAALELAGELQVQDRPDAPVPVLDEFHRPGAAVHVHRCGPTCSRR
jgi:hypothetical protein